MSSEHHPPLRVLRRSEVQKKVAKGRSTLHSMEDPQSPYFDPDWPSPFPLSRGTVGYYEHEIDRWLMTKAAARGKRRG